jgi:hypothetical protein
MRQACSISPRADGTFDDPQLTAAAQIPRIQARDATISGIKAEVNVANYQAHVALDSEVAATSVQARATVNLSDVHYSRASLDTQGMPIEGLLALFAPAKSKGPRAIVEVHASAEGPLEDRNRMQGQVIIPTLKAEYQGVQIRNARPIRIYYANFIVALDPTEIAERTRPCGCKVSFRCKAVHPWPWLLRAQWTRSCCVSSKTIFKVQGSCCSMSAEPGPRVIRALKGSCDYRTSHATRRCTP